MQEVSILETTPQRKMSVSMKGAMVLNKNKSGELQKRVQHLRKSRDEVLMELKAQRLQIAIRQINDEREQAAKKSDDQQIGSDAASKRKISKSSREAGNPSKRGLARLSLPPIFNKQSINTDFRKSISAPVSPFTSPLLRRATTRCSGQIAESKDEDSPNSLTLHRSQTLIAEPRLERNKKLEVTDLQRVKSNGLSLPVKRSNNPNLTDARLQGNEERRVTPTRKTRKSPIVCNSSSSHMPSSRLVLNNGKKVIERREGRPSTANIKGCADDDDAEVTERTVDDSGLYADLEDCRYLRCNSKMSNDR